MSKEGLHGIYVGESYCTRWVAYSGSYLLSELFLSPRGYQQNLRIVLKKPNSMYFMSRSDVLHPLDMIVDFPPKNSFNSLLSNRKKFLIIVVNCLFSFSVLFFADLSINFVQIFLFGVEEIDVIDETGSCIFSFVDIEIVVKFFHVFLVFGLAYFIFLLVDKKQGNFVLIIFFQFWIYISFSKN